MAAPTIADLFLAGVDILCTTVTDKTKKIVAQIGSIGQKADDGSPTATSQPRTDADNVEWWQHVGFASRPPKAEAGKNAAQGFGIRQGGIDILFASQDLRGLALYGNLKDGETCIYAPGADGNGQARVLLKADGSINLYTRKGNVDGGAGIIVQLDASAGAIRLLNDKGYGLIIDGDGVKLTSGGAAVVLTGGGDASLIGKGSTQVDGSSVVLGSVAIPGVNSALTGVTGIAGKASLKVCIE